MCSMAKHIEATIEQEPVNQIFKASAMYKSKFDEFPEVSYYKALERMSKQGSLVHLSKGLYYRPKKTRFGLVPISENEIIYYYTKDNRGLVIGYRLYNQKGLTTQISKKVEILSSALTEQKKTINNIHIKGCEEIISKENIPIIETLEILQNYGKIEDINHDAFASYMKKFVLNYSDKLTVDILSNRIYKKSTIAFLKSFLDFFKVKHSLGQFLSSLSKYKVPKVSDFYESA